MTTTEDIFSSENMLAYAKTCMEIALKVPDVKFHYNFDTLMIPSRGAVPFLLGMTYALGKFARISVEHSDLYKAMGVQPSMAGILPPECTIDRHVDGKGVKVLLVPFTADINMARFDPSINNDEFVESTRKYWTRVTAAFAKEPDQRSKDPYFHSFVDVIIKDVEQRGHLAEEYERFPTIGNFAMIDTVISGRASHDILTGFEQLVREHENPKLDPFAFLVIDENGAKLRPEHRRYINMRALNKKAAEFYVPRIVSEDKGASLLGVCALVYPSLMRASKQLELDGREFFVGAGNWRLCTDLSEDAYPYEDDFRAFMDVVYNGIDLHYDAEYEGKVSGKAAKEFEEKREDFAKTRAAAIYGNRNDESVEVLGLNPRYKVDNYFETASRVGHVIYGPDVTKEIVAKIRNGTSITSKHNHNDAGSPAFHKSRR